MAKTVEGLTTEGLTTQGIPHLLVVGVRNTDRDRDMLPVPSEWHRPSAGGAARFLRFLEVELLPFVDNHYRTGSIRILYGRSDSALFAVYALLSGSRAFSAVIASSPTVGVCPDLLEDMAASLLARRPVEPRSLFVVYGDNDIPLVRDHVSTFAARFARSVPKEIRFGWRAVPEGGHVPPQSLAEGLRFVFATESR